MKNLLAVLVACAAFGCSSSSSGPAPKISDFTMMTPIAAGTTLVTGSLTVSDPSGLADATLSLTISGNGFTSSSSIPVSGGTSTETEATVTPELELSASAPAGSYDVTVTLTVGGETSNPLSATVVVE